ncbi:MAG: glutathione S-transferase family protein [Acetobacteraceae bacterium]
MSGTMTLHWSPRSPYVRKVMIAAHELRLADRLRTVRTVVGGTTPHCALMQQNPLGKIPTLVLEDGTAIYDSAVICEYLDTLHDGPRLFPPWPERLTTLRRVALGDGMLDISLAWLGERFRPAERQSTPHIDLWRAKLLAAVDELEREADDLAAVPFSIAHIAIGVALGYLDFRFTSIAWRENRPRLTEWQATFDRRPSVRTNLPVDDR